MSTENTSFKTVLSSALVAAAVSAAGIGLFLANTPSSMAPVEQQQAAETKPAPQNAGTPVSKEDQTALIEKNREAFEALIRDYLLENPELLVEVSKALEDKQNEKQQLARLSAIKENADAIYRGSNPLLGGNPNGNVTVVEFADYNCPYCKKAFEQVSKLLEQDGEVKVIFKEFPIFGDASEGAARVAIAADKQGRYFDVHAGLLRSQGRVNEQVALKIAEELGLDMDKLREDMKSEEVKAKIEETQKLAQNLGIQGTPFYLVGDKVIPGAPDNLLEELKNKIDEIRKNGCTVKC